MVRMNECGTRPVMTDPPAVLLVVLPCSKAREVSEGVYLGPHWLCYLTCDCCGGACAAMCWNFFVVGNF